MNEYIGLIPEEFLLMRKEYLTVLLRKLPVIKAGRRGDKEVFRVYKDSRRYREISPVNSDWAETRNLFNQRAKIESSLRQTKNLLTHFKTRSTPCSLKTANLENAYSNNYYDRLIDGSCTLDNSSKYIYNGHVFRSRSEMQFAAILDEFGLEYKYDVVVSFAGQTYTVDFVIVFREFNRCVFVEYYGMCQDAGCNESNCIKIKSALNDGAYLGRDMFIMSGNKTYMPGPDVMRVFVASIIAQLSSEHIKVVYPGLPAV